MVNQKTKFKETEIGLIPEDWKIEKLGNISELIKGISYRSTDYSTPKLGRPFINLKCVERNGGFKNDGIKYYKGPVKENEFIYENDIFIANTDLTQNREVIGSPIILPKLNEKKDACFSLDLTKIVPDILRIEPKFLYYVLKSPSSRNFMVGNSNGTTVFHLSVKRVPDLEIPLPIKKEQEKIADVLGVLDEKIELNQKMNKTLEEIGQAMFKKYFGEYLNGENLPDGWKQSKIGDELEVFLGGTPSRTKKEYWENGNIPWINSGKVNDFRIINPSEYITEIGLEKSATKLLPKGTTVLAITGATLGQFSLLEIDTCFNQSVVGIKEGNILKKEFIYRWIETNINQIINSQTGGAQQHINKQIIEEFPIIVPKNGILENYYQEVSPLFELIKNNLFEIENLSEIRDSLLPKLMSGKLRVR